MFMEALGIRIAPQHSASTRGWNPNSQAGNPCPSLRCPENPPGALSSLILGQGGPQCPVSLLVAALLWTSAEKINTTGTGCWEDRGVCLLPWPRLSHNTPVLCLSNYYLTNQQIIWSEEFWINLQRGLNFPRALPKCQNLAETLSSQQLKWI